MGKNKLYIIYIDLRLDADAWAYPPEGGVMGFTSPLNLAGGTYVKIPPK